MKIDFFNQRKLTDVYPGITRGMFHAGFDERAIYSALSRLNKHPKLLSVLNSAPEKDVRAFWEIVHSQSESSVLGSKPGVKILSVAVGSLPLLEDNCE